MPAWLAPVAKVAVPILGSLFGSFMGNRAREQSEARARADMQGRQRQIDDDTQPYMSRGRNGQLNNSGSMWGNMLQQMMANTGSTPQAGFQFDPMQSNNLMASLIDPSRFTTGSNMPAWMGNSMMLDSSMSDGIFDFSKLMNPSSIGMGNTSTDALMQMMRGGTGIDPSLLGDVGSSAVDPITGEVSDVARTNLEDLATTGGAFSLTDMFSSLADVERTNLERSVAELQGSAGSIGQRFGTVLNQQEGRLRGELGENANLRRQELARQTHETAQGRRIDAASGLTAQDQILNQVLMANQGNMIQQGLGNMQGRLGMRGQDASLMSQESSNRMGAASTLAQLEASLFGTQMSGASSFNNVLASLMGSQADNQTRISMANQGVSLQEIMARNQFGMDGARIAQGDNALLAQILGQNAATQNNLGMFNETNAMNAGQFNTNTAMQSFQMQQQQQQFMQQMMQALIGQGLQQENFADSRALQALGIRAGVPTAGANPAAGGGWDAFAGAGNTALMMAMLGRGNGGGGGAPVAAFSPMQQPNFADPNNMWNAPYAGGRNPFAYRG